MVPCLARNCFELTIIGSALAERLHGFVRDYPGGAHLV